VFWPEFNLFLENRKMKKMTKILILLAMACLMVMATSVTKANNHGVQLGGVTISDYSSFLNATWDVQGIVNGSGMNGIWHSNGNGNGWLHGSGVAGPHWVILDLGAVTDISGGVSDPATYHIVIYNYNHSVLGRGSKDIEIWISPDDGVTTPFAKLDNAGADFVLAQGANSNTYPGEGIDTSAVTNKVVLETAKLVKIVLNSNYGDVNFTGLHEVTFAKHLDDVLAPTPDPATFSAAPAAGPTGDITMSATAGFDLSGVEYSFVNTAGGGSSSGWQASTSFTDTGLTPETEYTYTVQMRDGSAAQNAGGVSAAASVTTVAEDHDAPTPNPATFALAPMGIYNVVTGGWAVTMAATVAADSFPVEYNFVNTAGGGSSSGWQSSPNFTDVVANDSGYSYTIQTRDTSPFVNTGTVSGAVVASTAVLPAPHTDSIPETVLLHHFDSSYTGSNPDYSWVPEDNSAGGLPAADFRLVRGATVVTPATHPAGNAAFGNCLQFDGTNFAVVTNEFMPALKEEQLDANSVIEIEFWYKTEFGLDPVPNGTMIMDRWAQCIIRVQAGKIVPLTWPQDGGTTSITCNYVSEGTVIAVEGEWTHFKLVIDGPGETVTAYLNGSNAGSGALSGGLRRIGDASGAGQTHTWLGMRYNFKNFFKGKLDEFRITTSDVFCGSLGTYAGDFNGDCYVDENDAEALAEQFLQGGVGLLDDHQNLKVPMLVGAAPVIDGVFSPGEWDNSKIYKMAMPFLITPPNVGGFKGTKNGGYHWPDEDDFLGLFYYKWDADFLYFGYQLTDDIHSPSESDGWGYPNDHLLFGFEPNDHTANVDTLTYEMYHATDGSTMDSARVYWNRAGQLHLTDCPTDSSLDGSNVTYEAALKWSSIRGDGGFTAAIGDTFKHHLAVIDQDDCQGCQFDCFLFGGGHGHYGSAGKPEQWINWTLVDTLDCGDNGYNDLDFNKNCIVELGDFSLLSADWMKCTDPLDQVTCGSL